MRCNRCGFIGCACLFTEESKAAKVPVCKKCAGKAQMEELAEINYTIKESMKEQVYQPEWRHENGFEDTELHTPLAENQPIPRIFHWVWIGDNPLPDKDQSWLKSWQSKHPDWRFVIWCEHPENVSLDGFETFPIPPLANRKVYFELEKWVTGRAATAARSDIIRYEIIARHGGVYLDTDVECLKPIDELLQGVRLFVSDEWGPRPGNYMFGATPNHPALWTVVRQLTGHLNSFEGAANAVQATGPEYLNPLLRQYPNELVIFPHMLFNPVCAFDDPGTVEIWPKCSYGNHHYDGKWYDRTKNKVPAEFLK